VVGARSKTRSTFTPSTAGSTKPCTLKDFPMPRRFIPQSIDLSDFSQIEPLYQQLLSREPDSREALESFLADASELTAAVEEYGNRKYIAKSCHTEDREIEKAYLHYVENIDPKIKPLMFELQKV